MRILLLDRTSVAKKGTGQPGYFSRPLVDHLRRQGHEVQISPFDPAVCHAADVVTTEWTAEDAFEAAASGLCNRLVLHMRGYDVFHPLDKLVWKNVHALVYESPLLKSLAEERFGDVLKDVKTHVIASGIDLGKWPYKERKPGNVVAIFARADYRKGHQLVLEGARRRPDLEIHTTLALAHTHPRLVRYLRHAAPPNFHVHEDVPDVAAWADQIGASCILSPSIWEDLGYSIAEGMALGLKPLIHDFPGSRRIWPEEFIWKTLDELDALVAGPFDSKFHCAFVKEHYDGARQSEEFARVLFDGLARPAAVPLVQVMYQNAVQAVLRDDLEAAEKFVLDFRAEAGPEFAAERGYLALGVASLHRYTLSFPEAVVWALRALADGPRADALALLGEVSLEKADVRDGCSWYEAACTVLDRPLRVGVKPLLDGCVARRDALRAVLVGRSPMPNRPSRSIVTLSRFPDLLLRFCKAIRATGETAPMVVADDGLPSDLDLSAFEPIRRIPCPRPFIFARNANLAIAACGTDDVYFANDDTVLLTPNGLDFMAETAYEPGIGTVGAGFFQYGRPGLGATPVGTILEDCWVYAAVYLRQSLIDEIGPFDERFDGYGSEDDDHAIRVRHAGYKSVVDARCAVEHRRASSSFGRVFKPDEYDEQLLRERIKLMEKWGLGEPRVREALGSVCGIRGGGALSVTELGAALIESITVNPQLAGMAERLRSVLREVSP